MTTLWNTVLNEHCDGTHGRRMSHGLQELAATRELVTVSLLRKSELKGKTRIHHNISNRILLAILNYRANLAKLLGYDSFANFSMVTKMAGNLENVKTMIASLFVVGKK